jgi:hypothetical protein
VTADATTGSISADRAADSFCQHALIVMPFRRLGGQRFLLIKDSAAGDADATPASMIVVLNWTEELERLVRCSTSPAAVVVAISVNMRRVPWG